MWCPPTPPQDDSDLYIDYSLCFLYDQDVISEPELPPVYVKKELKRNRTENSMFIDGRRPVKIRKEDNYFPPRSLFDRPSPALAKLRRDLKIQRYRGNFKPLMQLSTLKQQQQTTPIPVKPLVEPEGMAEWSIYEDKALLNIIQNMQGLPLNLMLLSPGHTPNWDLVADIVNQTSRVYRTPKQCRYRYEAVIVPREEGKLVENPKKQPKKQKNPLKTSPMAKGIRALRTSQLFANDKNASFTKMVRTNFEFIKTAYVKKQPHVKQILINPSLKNPKHAAVLSDFGITNYDMPLSPFEIAARRAEKLKERNRGLPTGSIQQIAQVGTVAQVQNQPIPELVQHVPAQHSPQVVQATQQITAHIPNASVGQQSATAYVVQQQVPSGVTQVLPSVATIVQAAQSIQASRAANVNMSHQQQTQIVKVVAASPHTSNIINSVQHVPITQTQHVHQQQQSLVSQSPVSVVLTAPVSSMQNMSSQIVSIQQGIIPNSSTVMTQSTGQLLQPMSSQSPSTSQVVSMSQLSGVGTVFTTSALPSNAVATLTTQSLRAQRIVTAPGLQEMVFSQRTGSQSPTVVSVSGLSTQNLNQGQLRLSMGGNQQVSGIVKGGIPIGALTAAGKPINQPTQFQILRQNPSRQQFKVLNTAQGNTVLQTVGGQVSVVNPSGTIIQGGIVTGGTNVGQTLQLQQQTGQKVSIATVSNVTGSPGMVTNVATVQMSGTGNQQQRTHFMKQMGTKQQMTRSVTMPVSDAEMLLVKRQMISQTQANLQQSSQQQQQNQTNLQQQQNQQGQQTPHQQQKTQILSSFSPSIQLQQTSGVGGQQHIATLVKTSSGTMATSAAGVGMTLAQIKPGQLKATLPNASTTVRQMQLQQIPIGQQRKAGGKMTQIAQVSGNVASTSTTGATVTGAGMAKGAQVGQLIVQNTKNLQPGTVTVQQIQQVMRQAQPNQIVLGKSVGRIIPVSVSSQPNSRQTIQVSFNRFTFVSQKNK